MPKPQTTGSQGLENWIKQGSYSALRGHRIFTRTAITPGKDALLLIHGYPTASYDWHRLWDPLAERYSLYTLDMLGFGLSAKPRNATYSIGSQADLCEALLQAHGITQPHILAHDYGATVAQEMLSRELEGRLRLASVCFLNGGLFPETHRARPVQKMLANPFLGPVIARMMRHAGFEKAMLQVAGKNPPSRAELFDQWQLIERGGGRPALARLISYMEQRRLHRERWVGALVQSRVPRRLLCGAADPVSGRHLAERYKKLVPDPEVVLFDEVGHYPQLEDATAVLEAYLEFRWTAR